MSGELNQLKQQHQLLQAEFTASKSAAAATCGTANIDGQGTDQCRCRACPKCSTAGPTPESLQCVDGCITKVPSQACRTCLRGAVDDGLGFYNTVMRGTYVTQRSMRLPFSRVGRHIPLPTVGLEPHNFAERPPLVHGAAPLGDNETVAGFMKHGVCPAMRGRVRVTGITVRMPYTARYHRDGTIEVVCDWIDGSPVKRWRVNHPTDSPEFRLPQTILEFFAIGDSRTDVWIVNSCVYVQDASYQQNPGWVGLQADTTEH